VDAEQLTGNKESESWMGDLVRWMPTYTFDILRVGAEDAGTVEVLTFVINCSIIQ